MSSPFTIHPPYDLNISDFFKETEIALWSFSNFFNYILSKGSKLTEKVAREHYKQNLSQISDLSLPRNIKTIIGRMKKRSAREESTENSSSLATTVTYNNSIVIENSKNFKISNCFANETVNKRKTDDELENEEASPNIEDQEDILEAWRAYLNSYDDYNFSLDNKLHVF